MNSIFNRKAYSVITNKKNYAHPIVQHFYNIKVARKMAKTMRKHGNAAMVVRHYASGEVKAVNF